MRIGGSGHIIEIDESCFGKHKYSRGRMIQEQQWVFGSIDPESRERFMVSVDRKMLKSCYPLSSAYLEGGKWAIAHLRFQLAHCKFC